MNAVVIAPAFGGAPDKAKLVPYSMSDDADEGYLIDDCPPAITPGRYEGVYVRHETSLYKGVTPKVYVYFKITSPGPFEGMVLARYYNVRALIGKPRQAGGFWVGKRSDYYREFVLVADRAGRRDRLSPVAFKGKVIAVEVGNVCEDGNGRSITKDAQYSTITRILGEV